MINCGQLGLTIKAIPQHSDCILVKYIAIGQNIAPPPQGLVLEVQDARGNWVAAKSGLGFLSGKLKTMVLDLDGVFRAGAPRRLRLRTNLEIYWDKLEWAEAAPSNQIKIQQMDAASAELRYRGFSRFTQANASSPELPDYNRLAGTAPRWRDLAGYYTRHGDVRELLAKTDDRMLLMNAGDELRLTFQALPAPPDGWTRDFVMIGDGWTKDGDYNCTHAATVLPLPFHGIRDYNRASTRLEDNPAYKLHPPAGLARLSYPLRDAGCVCESVARTLIGAISNEYFIDQTAEDS